MVSISLTLESGLALVTCFASGTLAHVVHLELSKVQHIGPSLAALGNNPVTTTMWTSSG